MNLVGRSKKYFLLLLPSSFNEDMNDVFLQQQPDSERQGDKRQTCLRSDDGRHTVVIATHLPGEDVGGRGGGDAE
jgi:hypothetical protein